MRALALASLLLVLILVALAAYLRLDHSGIGCEPWPQCYGNIGVATDTGGAAAVVDRLLEEARTPPSWATPAHRLVATVLGLLIVALCLMSLFQRRDRLLSFALLVLTIFLALLGVRSGGLHSPAIVMGNLGGGFAMLGLLGWLVLKKPRDKLRENAALRTWSLLALVLLCLQIGLGGLTSANFAASACRTLPDCHGSWLPGKDVVTAFDLTREHDIGTSGMVVGGAERAEIQKLHRLIAIATVIVVLFAASIAVRAGGDLRVVGYVAGSLVLLELIIGIASIASELPIALAVAHNAMAALLLLGLLKLVAESQAGTAARL